MLIETKRCKHCGSEYEYQRSGEGCLEPHNNEEYCPECMKAIIDALNKIPKRYIKKFMKIAISPILFNELKKIKEEPREGLFLFSSMIVSTAQTNELDFDHIELYEYHCQTYALCYNDVKGENESNYTLFVMQEYDLINKEFTSKTWYNNLGWEFKSFRYGTNMMRSFSKMANKITPKQIDAEEISKIADFEWRIESKNNNG